MKLCIICLFLLWPSCSRQSRTVYARSFGISAFEAYNQVRAAMVSNERCQGITVKDDVDGETKEKDREGDRYMMITNEQDAITADLLTPDRHRLSVKASDPASIAQKVCTAIYGKGARIRKPAC